MKQKVVEQKITKDMTLGELVQNFPSAVEVLLEEGIHCVGCGAAYWETVEQGLAVHGKTKKEIDTIIRKLNKVSVEES